MNKLLTSNVLLFIVVLCGGSLRSIAQSKPLNKNPMALSSKDLKTAVYKNPKASIADRVNDLLKRMTLEEKTGQLLTLLGWEMYDKEGTQIKVSDKFKKALTEQSIGSLWATLRADPWTKKTIATGLNPYTAAETTNMLQKYVLEHSRLQIPLFLAEECPHGHMAIGTTVFPTAIGQGSTWNPELIGKMAAVIAREARLQGAHIGYGPVLDLAREPRWSRVEETYGEDPFLNGQMGAAMVRGFQGTWLESKGIEGIAKGSENVIATLKHFAAYGVPEGGHNGGLVNTGTRELYQSYLPPFKAAVAAGALSLMTAYNSIDGVPCTSNSFLLNDVLRKQWAFKGFVVSDLGSIDGLMTNNHVAATMSDAAALALSAGVDSDLGGRAFGDPLLEAIKKAPLLKNQLDEAVRRILTLKFKMGLFENPYVDPERAKQTVRNQEAIAIARSVAQESIILLKNGKGLNSESGLKKESGLKNENRLLPLSKNIKSIAVIGPNADNIYNQLGDYTAPQDSGNVVTVLDGIKAKLPVNVRLRYVKGCAIRDTSNNNIAEAVQAAMESEVTVVVLGGSSARDFRTEYISTGAANASLQNSDRISDMESGEGYDRETLELMGKQLTLLQELVKTGKPIVLVFIGGRPLNLNWPTAHVPAIVNAWYPGQQGGNAIADVLFGDYNPAGRLPISIPRSVGQLPVYYNYKRPMKHNYVEGTADPLFSFGFGLSYSQFLYTDLKVESVEGDGLHVKVSFNVANTSNVDGDEVLQLYVQDEVASVVLPVKELKAFKRIPLKAKEQKTVVFELKKEDLALFNVQMKQVVEAGKFKIMVGAGSEDIRLEKEINILHDYPLNN
jgi:beta-glucosidase